MHINQFECLFSVAQNTERTKAPQGNLFVSSSEYIYK